jgi:hypothetical protein
MQQSDTFDPGTGEILDGSTGSPQPPPAPAPVKRARKKKRGNGRIPPPPDETKRARFIRLANRRFDQIVHAMHVMRSLGRNQSAYDYGDADIDQITDKLVAELEQMKAEMKRRGRPVQTRLDLQ